MMRVLAPLAAALLAAAPALAAPVAADTPATTGGGAAYTVPAAWEATSAGRVTVVRPPEPDARVAIVEVGAAPDARAAAEAAWAAFDASAKPPFKLLTPRPGREGWDERAIVDYEVPPNARRAVQAIAYRKGKDWTVVVLDAGEGTIEKRAAAANLLIQSLRPAGYARESFAGREPNPLTPERVDELKAFVLSGMKQLEVPGAGFALIENDRILFEGGLGVKTIGRPDPVTEHTRFIIASNTKSMATMLLAKLVDEGKLRWDEPVVEAYPQFRLGSDASTRATQIRHLVCACTGLPRKDYQWFLNTRPDTPAADTFVQLAATQPTSGFGEVFQYNNLMASAAGYVAGHLFYPKLELGAAFDRAVETEIWRPLGMTDSTFSVDAALRADHADPHGFDPDGRVIVTSQDANRAIAPYRPAGGAWSSAHDMIRYVGLELRRGVGPDGKRLISEQNLLARRARGVSTGENSWYGMGLEEVSTWGVPVIHHGGDLIGYHSDMIWVPGANVGMVILTNGDWGAALRRPLMRRLLEVLYDGRPEAEGDLAATAKRLKAAQAEERSKLTIPPDPAAVAALAPAYGNPDLGPLRVERDGANVRFRFTTLSTAMATKKNDDGTVSFVTIEPGIDGLPVVVGEAGGKRTLTTRDAQHEYVFTETR